MKRKKIKDTYILWYLLTVITGIVISFYIIVSLIISDWMILIPMLVVLELVAVFPIIIGIIIKSRTYYYLLPDEIIKIKNGIEIGKINTNSIYKVSYVNPIYIFFLQLGAGGLIIELNKSNNTEPYSICYNENKAILNISMSKKEAIRISNLLNKSLD